MSLNMQQLHQRQTDSSGRSEGKIVSVVSEMAPTTTSGATLHHIGTKLHLHIETMKGHSISVVQITIPHFTLIILPHQLHVIENAS